MRLVLLPLLVAAGCAPGPPVARRDPHPRALHGQTFVDDYFWLRKKGAPEVEAYLRAENDYTARMMKPTEALQERLYKELVARIEETDKSVPRRENGYYYYTRTVAGLQYPILCRRSAKGAAADDLVGETATAPEEVLLDANEIGKTHKYVGIGARAISDDARWMAYAVDVTGFREHTLRFKDLSTGQLAPESIARVGTVAWAADNKTVFYTLEDEAQKRAYRVYRHLVGSEPAKDVLVYEEKDERFELGLARTRSRAFVLIGAGSMTTTEWRMLDAHKPDGEWRVIEPRQQDHLYSVDQRGDELYITTNLGADGKKAVNFRLVTAPLGAPGRSNWRELIPHRPDVMLEDVQVFADHIVVQERADAQPRLRVLGGNGSTEIPLPEQIRVVFPEANAEMDTTAFRFHFQSPITPDSVYDWDIRKKSLLLRKRTRIKNYDPAGFVTERVHATAKDGTRIPISLVYKKGLPAGRRPMLLVGYGSYGFPFPTIFSADHVSLLERGVVLAIAHVRGGGEMGKAWHDAGRMAHKMNTFTDFIAAAESLISDGRTGRDRLVIQGGSAGGLLMGAVTNLRPDLWKGVVAKMPFLDVINTMLDDSLPGTVPEFEEWGNPKKKDEYEWIFAYSPYDNLARKAYPAMLVVSSYNDSQVMYWEPAKYVARLRALKTDNNPLYFRINMEPAGHGGQAGRYRRMREVAFDDAWILTQLGIAN